MKKIVLIVAGGKGSRMKSSVPKQFLVIQDKPVLVHTINKFLAYDAEIELRLVLPDDQQEAWEKISTEHKLDPRVIVFSGGDTRFQSVKNGLHCIDKNTLVAVHDGVRPLVSVKTIDGCFKEAKLNGAAIPVIPVKESIRKVLDNSSLAEDRSRYRLVQTPQVFRADILMEAYEQEYISEFTDDASIVEKCGYTISLVMGNEENIKITSPIDLVIANQLLIVS